MFYGAELNISEMLSRNARVFPTQPALIELAPSRGLRREMTWSEFDSRANRVARSLADMGIGKGDKVLHLMRNSIEWLVAYFGIVRTGAWAVPLNFRFTSRDIAYCAGIAGGKAMFLEAEFVERVSAVKAELVTVKDYIFAGNDTPPGMHNLDSLLAGVPARPPPVTLNPEDPCALYFTSGTTGAPKPILLTHRNMEWAAIVEQKHHHQTDRDNFLLLPPLYHTGAKMHWFGSLLVGGRATLLTEISPRAIIESAAAEVATIVWLLVPWTRDILEALDRDEINLTDYDLSGWRLMHIGAQPVPPSLVKRWKRYFPGMAYDTNYGLGEASGPGCVHLGIENERKVGAIGKAGYGYALRIVDAGDSDVAAGEVGELLVKGPGVMREYFRNPDKTAETLRGGWLHTGDMCREDEDGFIFLVDRKKDLVITGGENIYPVEIEEVLLTHPAVHDCAVIGMPDDRLGETVCLIVDPLPDRTVTLEEVSSFCDKNLPRYKRPRHIIFDKIPRNPTGKIEKTKLRDKHTSVKESTKISRTEAAP